MAKLEMCFKTIKEHRKMQKVFFFSETGMVTKKFKQQPLEYKLPKKARKPGHKK